MSFKLLEAELLDHFLKIGAYTEPTTIAVALFAVAATDGAAGTECSGGAYARVNRSSGATHWNAATGSGPATADNNGIIDFAEATADYSAGGGDPIQVNIFDATSAGNNLAFSATFAAVDINNGDTPRINDGQLDVTLD